MQLFSTPSPDPDPTAHQAPRLEPLATQLRPQTIADVVGQEHLLGPGKPLHQAFAARKPHSMILHGPPGTGKTTIARLLGQHCELPFEELSAVQVGRPELRAVFARARDHQRLGNGTTLLFLDEIHRFNKAQQDALLPAVESGLVTLIGATTENPFFEVNPALRSRVQIYTLQPLTPPALVTILAGAAERLPGSAGASMAAIELLARAAGGDARLALSALSAAAELVGDSKPIGTTEARVALERGSIRYDRAGEQHYNYASAFIKALRASDPDAGLYYLAVMLEAGEDPRFIARRIVIFASEDVGNADPQALAVATATAAAVEHVGLPECQYNLAQGVIYLALAPKANSAKAAIIAAREYVRVHGAAPPPDYLCSTNSTTQLTRSGGERYDYPHSHITHTSPQEVMPVAVAGTHFYTPDATEKETQERYERVLHLRKREPKSPSNDQ